MSKSFFYLITEPPKNVVMSQVIEYAEVLERMGMEFRVLFLLPAGEFIRNRARFKEAKRQIEKRLKRKPELYVGYTNRGPAGIIQGALILALRLLPLLLTGRHLVFHCRGGYSSSILNKLRKLFRKIDYVYDVRGDSVAEFEYLSRDNMPEEERKRRIEGYVRAEKKLIRNASHTFCVSNVLKGKIVDGYDAENSKVTVIPCAADSVRFSFDARLRDEKRKSMGITDRFVLIYPGGIGNWHSSDRVFSIAASVMRRHPEVYFIVLTQQKEKAAELARELLPEGRYYIDSASRDEMPAYLMAADMGMLLREDHPLNHVAAPTKFAEYVISGLPVMISENIGDYSRFVEENRIGIVIRSMDDKEEYLGKFGEFFFSRHSVDRQCISQLGCLSFSKQKYAGIMKQVYLSI